MNDLTLHSKTGGTLTACSDQNRDEPDYLSWAAGPGCMFGIMRNTPETRKFLEDVLRRFRKDASRLAGKNRKRLLREIGERDAIAGKSIDAFQSLTHADVGLTNTSARRRFRLTESMRAEYEIGYRAAKKEKSC